MNKLATPLLAISCALAVIVVPVFLIISMERISIPRDWYEDDIRDWTLADGWQPSSWSEMSISGRWDEATLMDVGMAAAKHAAAQDGRDLDAENEARLRAEGKRVPPREHFNIVVGAVKVSDGDRWNVFLVFKAGTVQPLGPRVNPDTWRTDVRRLVTPLK